MFNQEARFYPQESNPQKGRVTCQNCPALKTTPIKDEISQALGRTTIYECGRSGVSLESNEPEASLSPVPGFFGLFAGTQVLITGVKSWERSFICPNTSVKKSANK